MARIRLSEYRAKNILNTALSIPYVGWMNVHKDSDNTKYKAIEKYVIKVDQAVKGRYKKGLIKLNVSGSKVAAEISTLRDQGYGSFIVEPYVSYDQNQEQYLAISYGRSGYIFTYSRLGGVDIEEHADSIESYAVNDEFDWGMFAIKTGFGVEQLRGLIALFKESYFVSLEINPYISSGTGIHILDCAVEVDDAGQYFTDAWSQDDIRHPSKIKLSDAEKNVTKLNQNSPASFNLSILNPDGSIFLLLSGGGASVVVADEIYNMGQGSELANYGEYSGNPTIDETYEYTKQLLDVLVESKATKKVLFIGGAVANFTDIANTFEGIIAAIDEYAVKLSDIDLKVYVRRGGPNQEIGLHKMNVALTKHGILGGVYGPDVSISSALGNALQGLKT